MEKLKKNNWEKKDLKPIQVKKDENEVAKKKGCCGKSKDEDKNKSDEPPVSLWRIFKMNKPGIANTKTNCFFSRIFKHFSRVKKFEK